MSDYTLSKTIAWPYGPTLDVVRAGLANQGLGILIKIDLAATLHTGLGVTIPAQVTLGACRPRPAYEAIRADPFIAAVLPATSSSAPSTTPPP